MSLPQHFEEKRGGENDLKELTGKRGNRKISKLAKMLFI